MTKKSHRKHAPAGVRCHVVFDIGHGIACDDLAGIPANYHLPLHRVSLSF